MPGPLPGPRRAGRACRRRGPGAVPARSRRAAAGHAETTAFAAGGATARSAAMGSRRRSTSTEDGRTRWPSQPPMTCRWPTGAAAGTAAPRRSGSGHWARRPGRAEREVPGRPRLVRRGQEGQLHRVQAAVRRRARREADRRPARDHGRREHHGRAPAGGVDLPDRGDVDPVKSHLARYYSEAGRRAALAIAPA